MGDKDHKQAADQAAVAVRAALLVVSDSKTADTDTSGKLAYELMVKFGHEIVDHRIVKNDRRAVLDAIAQAEKAGANVILAIGGTGVSKKDLTADVVRESVAKELPGFGEMFRRLSEREIGTAAILSRALLGTTDDGRVIAALPGSTAAVRLALDQILLAELRHLLWELQRYP